MFAVSGCGASGEPPAPAPSPAGNGAGNGLSAVSDSLWGVAALAESDAWAVGKRELGSDSGVVLTLTEHWDGQSWKVVPSPSPGGIGEQARGILEAVAIDSPDDAWAVGTWSPAWHDVRTVPPVHGLIEHWNGAKWTVVPGPSPGGHATELTAVAAISPTAAWATGLGTAGGHQITVFMHWNGTIWRYLPSPAGTPGGLAVISARDIWMVGAKGPMKSAPKYRTLAEHWNGSKWTIVPTPNGFKGRTGNSGLSAVGGSSSSNVWAVGNYQSGPNGDDRSPLVEHWDGTQWRLQPSPDPVPPQNGGFLDAIAALSGTSAFAVGSAFGSGPIPIIEGWDGVHWTAIQSRLQPGATDPTLSGVAAVQPGYAWAVGYAHNHNYRPITLIEKWNGTSWQQVPSPNP